MIDKKGLIDILKEAASIISEADPKPKNMRYPIVDELLGYAAMLDNVKLGYAEGWNDCKAAIIESIYGRETPR